jgi:hypothetical protein
VFEGDFSIKNGKIIVPVTNTKSSWGYNMVITQPKLDEVSRYEAEEAKNKNGKILTADKVSNEQYVSMVNPKNGSLEFDVYAKSEGKYILDIRYANNGDESVISSVCIDNSLPKDIVYEASSGWLNDGRAKNTELEINLKKGINKIKLIKSKDVLLEFDYIQVCKVPDIFELRVEAENSTINNAVINSSSYASCQQYVRAIDFEDSYVEFKVNVENAGNYQFDIGYGNGGTADSTMLLTVNNTQVGSVTLPATGAWLAAVPNPGARKIVTENIELSKGENIIRLSKDENYAELDYILIR